MGGKERGVDDDHRNVPHHVRGIYTRKEQEFIVVKHGIVRGCRLPLRASQYGFDVKSLQMQEMVLLIFLSDRTIFREKGVALAGQNTVN